MFNKTISTIALLVPFYFTAATAATITLTDPSLTLTASVDYRIFVNNGGNQTGAGVYIGSDPANLTHTAFNVTVDDGDILSLASLDLALSSSGPSGSRIASYFVDVPSSATYDPNFTAARSPQYTVAVSSSGVANSYTGSGSVAALNLLSLVNFATLLDEANTGRTVSVNWHDGVDFVVPANMPKNAVSLPGNNGPREYRWLVTASLTGQGQLNLETSAPHPVPEPASLLLMGSSLIALTVFANKFRKKATMSSQEVNC